MPLNLNQVIDAIHASNVSEENFKAQQTLLRKAESELRGHLSNGLLAALGTLSPADHSYGYLYLLCGSDGLVIKAVHCSPCSF